MRSILSKYIITNFLKSFLIVFLCFFAIVSIFESMEIVRRYFSNSINVSSYQIVKLTICHSIVSVCSFFSFMIFLASIVFYTTMHSKLELTVIKVVGISTQNIFKSLFVAVSILGVLYISVFDGFSAFSINEIKKTDIKLKQETRGIDKNLTITNSGVWFRDVFESSFYIVSAKTFDSKKLSLFNVRIFEFGKNNELVRSIHTPNAVISKGYWNLGESSIVTSAGLETQESNLKLPTRLSFSNINKMVANPNSVSFWSVGKYISMLDKVGLSSIKYRIHWFSRLSSILQMFAFVMLATAFCINYNSRNTRSYIIKVAILISLAFPIHFFNNVMIAFGESEIIPIAFSAFFIPALTLLIGTVFVEKK